MSDGIQLKDIRATTTDLPPPAYVSYENPAFGSGEGGNGDVRSRNNVEPAPSGAYDAVEAGTNLGYRNQGFSPADANENQTKPYTISPGHGGRKHPTPPDDVDPPLYEEEDAEEDGDPNCFVRFVTKIQTGIKDFYETHEKLIWKIFYIFLLLAYAAYFAYAMYYYFGDEGSIRLLWVTCLVVFVVFCVIFFNAFGPAIGRKIKPCVKVLKKYEEPISWIAVAIILLFVIIFVIVDVVTVSEEPYNLVSASGIVVYIVLFYIFSYNPAKVKWRPVAWGLAIQFLFAMIILRWDRGYSAFKWLGDRVAEFLKHTDAGSMFVFGDTTYTMHFFAFAVLPIVIFFSSFISMLYYLGIMQGLIKRIAIVMQVLMGTTAGESLNAAGNIFIGQSEAPLLIRPLIGNMTRSELHAVLTGGFATIAGTVLGAYISFGAPANHLISASVMSAPAALAMSKLFYPETKKSKTTAKDVECMEKSQERNIIEAASAGASTAIALVANIAANLIAFIALKEFLNATLTWFGERVGIFDPPLTFELICSYVLYPFSIVMGVDPGRDSRNVARLIGVKTFVNEFVAYTDLGKLMSNKETFYEYVSEGRTWEYTGDLDITFHTMLPKYNTTHTLEYGFLTERSEVISTYALCGFANLGSMGIMLGSLGAMAPHRKADLASIVLRAMIAGNVACFMTACIAGLFYRPDF